MVYQKIKNYLDENGIKQKWLAQEAGISASKLSLILTGKAPLYTDLFFLLCSKLGVSSEMFRDHSPPGQTA